MKYRDVPKEKVKEICKKMRYRAYGRIVRDCEKCPLRRTAENGKTLFCYYRLADLYEAYEKEYKELEKEEVHHPTELESYLLETQE